MGMVYIITDVSNAFELTAARSFSSASSTDLISQIVLDELNAHLGVLGTVMASLYNEPI